MSRKTETAQDVQEPLEAPSDTPAPDAPAEGSTDASSDVQDDPTTLLLRGWLDNHIAGGPIGRDTICWNALQNALPALRELINGQTQEG